MATPNYYQEYIKDIGAGISPGIKQQQDAMYEYILGQGQRQGVGAAMQNAMRATAPYAEKASQALAGEAGRARQMAQKQEQYDEQMKQRQTEFQQQQANWEKSMQQQQEQQNMANMLAMFQYTGWTPDLLNALGYGDLTQRSQQQFMRNAPFGNPPLPGAAGPDGAVSPGVRSLGGTQYTVGRNHPLYRAQ